MKYVLSRLHDLRKRYIAAAILSLGDYQNSAQDWEGLLQDYRKKLDAYLNREAAGDEYLFYRGISPECYRVIQEAYKQTHAPEAASMLKVMKALEWSNRHMRLLDVQMKNNLWT